ncbi:hypothetical protein LVD17_22755 [Fulvivirga ulvae]|uniref:hypothetical protein n=1 Tax=Fulvivirga ulvae TaxID=2904245 RepID=UPI001F1F0DDD|nr:hypothetical protein [Fulvivirga ulvae]UII31116.1 hypothetical protein LVD17_22755 [Fulvivirga ulvae]
MRATANTIKDKYLVSFSASGKGIAIPIIFLLSADLVRNDDHPEAEAVPNKALAKQVFYRQIPTAENCVFENHLNIYTNKEK